MRPELIEGNIRADCPDCGVPTSFEWRKPGGSQFGDVLITRAHQYGNSSFNHIIYKLYRCAVCSRPGVAKLHVVNNFPADGTLEWFWPTALKHENVPDKVPPEILNEFREAELCMSVAAWRAAAALLRSALEKALKANGYDESNLYKKIEAVGDDGVITSARRQRAQDLVRTLGNDVLHDDWRVVTQEEVEDAHRYVARIFEDLYDDRATVEKILTSKNRKFM